MGTVKNPRFVDYAFGKFTGKTGIVEKDGLTRIAFFADIREMTDVKSGTLDGEAYIVAQAVPSNPAKGGVKKMVVLTIEPVTVEAAPAETPPA